jgi:hypothetical protein
MIPFKSLRVIAITELVIATFCVVGLAWQTHVLRLEVESVSAESRRQWERLGEQVRALPRIHVPDAGSP